MEDCRGVRAGSGRPTAGLGQVKGWPPETDLRVQPPPDSSLLPEAGSVCIEVRRATQQRVSGNTGRTHLLLILKVLSQQRDVQTQGLHSFLINRLAVRG